MNFFNKLQSSLEKIVGPFATMVSNSKYIKALTEGFMYTMPITLGVAIIAVLSNIPIDPWLNFLKNTGLYSVGQDIVSLSLSLLAIYVVGAIGYCFTRNEGEQGIIGAVMATASFIMLMPIQSFPVEGSTPISALTINYMGSDGIFLAIIIGLFIPKIYCVLMSKNLRLKLPESVPPMVSQSLAPTFVAMIIFVIVFIVKWGCTFTSYGNLFNIISTLIGKPISYFGASPTSMILVFTLMNLIWFFGIHPNALFMPYLPVLMMTQMANVEAFLQNKPMPYIIVGMLSICIQLGGTGNTLGLCIATLFAKSEKYKAMRKLVIPANIFNINEPIIFGFPVMLNPLYIIPMVFSPMASGFVAWGLMEILPITFSPTVSMPWVTPGFITAFFQGGIFLLLIWLISLFIHFIMYLPFFLIDDKNALKQEQEMKTE